jgi:anti-sigma regulatory factor (Ser/Thr protein kinase)
MITEEIAETAEFESSDRAAMEARAFVAATFTRWGVTEHYMARLVVSELVTNAYRYGEGGIRVRLCMGGLHGLPVVEVYDRGSEMPTMLPQNHASINGRGLPTIADICDAWGVRPVEGGGKVVWARLKG